jgi:hypothetical protein
VNRFLVGALQAEAHASASLEIILPCNWPRPVVLADSMSLGDPGHLLMRRTEPMPITDPAVTLHINGAEHKLVLEPWRTLLVARRS